MTLEEHNGIIIEALEDYRRWWDDDNPAFDSGRFTKISI
jgi:hypothetical protein